MILNFYIPIYLPQIISMLVLILFIYLLNLKTVVEKAQFILTELLIR